VYASTTEVRLGQRVPDFELLTYDPARNEVGRFSMAQQIARGRWTILFFYTADFSYACTGELEALAQHHDEFVSMGCDVVAVSTDTHHAHHAWRRSEKALAHVNYQMGADRSGEVSRLFGVFDSRSGLALRGTFLILPDGTLMSAEVNFYNLARNIEELLRKLRAAAYTVKHPSEICAPQWRREGDRTLKDPGTDA
jgi:peroxiredoxin (alkyl hydroperoxide reductase subunit C)